MKKNILFAFVFPIFLFSLALLLNPEKVSISSEQPNYLESLKLYSTWLDFDGTGKISINDAEQLEPLSQATWNIWVKQNQYTSNAGLFGKYAPLSGKRSYIIRTVSTNRISLVLSPDGVNTETITSSSNYACGIQNNGEWTMLTLTYDGYAVTFYKNGIRCEEKKVNTRAIYNALQPLIIGGANNVFFNGAIDDAAVYPNALSKEQVLNIYDKSDHGNSLGQAIPVIVYHRIENIADSSTKVSITNFTEQMQFLHDNGFTSITAQNYLDWKNGLFDMPEKPVMITFDDGWKSVYNAAYPIMKSYGFVGTVFIVTRYMGFTNPYSNYMNWTNLRELKGEGWGMESHSITHSNMLNLNEQDFRNELDGSKQQIIQNLDTTPTSFVFPFHLTDQSHTDICGEYYDLCWTWGNEPKTPAYVYKSTDGKIYKSLRRINIYNSVTMPVFQNIFSQGSTQDLIEAGEWKINEGEGEIVYDSSGNQNNGLLSGGYSWISA